MLKKITKKTFSPWSLITTFAVFALLIAVFLTKTNLLKYIYAAGEPLTIDAPVTFSGTNTISAPKFIDTANSAYFFDPAATGTSLVTAGNVGIGTVPSQKLSVAGTIESTTGGFKFPDATTQTSAASALPAGLVSFFNLAACPSGWTELTGARGRYIVGLPSGGTLAGTSGTALTNLESRAVGQHTHGISDPGHAHSVPTKAGRGGGGSTIEGDIAVPQSTNTGASTTGITTFNAGSVAGTNAPYIQLLACQKS